MLFQEGADVAEGLGHVVADGVFGNAQGGGDLVLGKALLAAHAVDGALLVGQALDGGPDKAAGFFAEELLLGVAFLIVEVVYERISEGLVAGALAKLAENVVTGHDEEVVAEAFDGRQFRAFEPYLEEDVLDHVFCQGGGFGELKATP